MNFEPEHANGGYRLMNASDTWYKWAEANVLPEGDKNFEIVYVGIREYDDGYDQVVVCIRTTNPDVKVEKNVRLPADKLVKTELLFFKP
jgi:hypothetical protein